MKATIEVTGQMTSVGHIVSELTAIGNPTVKNGQYHNRTIIYNTKKEAVQAMRSAYAALKEDGAEYSGERLRYDAATAIIYDKVIR